MDLDERKQKILGAVVRDYVETVKPLGSEELAQRHQWGIKSATIRNELAELSDLGFLRQPHTSAGRIPSDLGYRFYVDHLMALPSHDDAVTPILDEEDQALEMERLLRRTCALLTRTTSYTSVATPPRPADTHINQIFVTPAGEDRLLLVMILSTGKVENRLLCPAPPEAVAASVAEMTAVTNALNTALMGQALDTLPALSFAAPDEFSHSLRVLYSTLISAAQQMAQAAADDDRIYLEGASEILRQPEFRDVAKIECVLETLQRGTLLFQTLSRALLGADVTVVIGAENHVPAMTECSVVTASYYVGTRKRGTLGVVGPTRMDYDKAVPAVGFFSRTLSRTLTRLAGLS
ncbi:MAG: heat-inducible transcriptional repressor HrcA [Janthinobacterium lividum]